MSPNMKISLLALVGAAAAVPHYNAHSAFHHKSSAKSVLGTAGYAGPTGGWVKGNSTGPFASGSGTGTAPVPVADKTSLLDSTSTQTVYNTVYATRSHASAAASAVAADASGPAGGAGACGPATVYVTTNHVVTVTVPAGGAGGPPASSAKVEGQQSAPGYVPVQHSAPVVPAISSKAPYVAPVPSSKAPVVPAISSKAPVVPAISSKAPVVPVPEVSSKAPVVPVPVPSSAAVPVPETSAVVPPPVSSAVPVPASSAAPAPASSAAPKPSSSPSGPGYAGGKRGLAYRWDGAADAKTYESGNFGFCWDWEADTKGDIGSLAKNFIPTLRTMDNAGEWPTKWPAAIEAGSKVVFGFNEPDRPDQSHMDVNTTCGHWQDLMNPIAKAHGDVTIVGPSVSNSQNENEGLKWLADFKQNCPEAVWHEANIHWYDNADVGFDGFKKHVDDAISQFGKVWVTEFALNPGATMEQSKDFLEKATKYLDENENCSGYSYFAVGSFDPKFNMLGSATNPTELGKLYMASS